MWRRLDTQATRLDLALRGGAYLLAPAVEHQ